MGTVTRSHTFTSGEILTAANLNGEINGLVSAVNGNLDANNVDTSAIPTLTATQTLTNKTLTAPKIGTSILDTNGNELFLLTATGSAVNEFTLANAATSGSPTLSATGGDSNIDITLTPKGTGQVVITTDLKITGDDLYMNTNTSGHILVADGTNYNPVAVSGDVTIASSGAVTIANDAVTNAMMADDAIDTPQIADDAITAALIDDNAVGTAAIASSTTLTTPTLTSPVINVTSDANGDIYYRASGAFARLAKGTAGQVLKMNDGATAPEWGAGSVGGASNLTGLSDVTINSVADKHILIYDGTSNVFENHLLDTDLEISNEGAVTIANDAITSAKIADDAIITALIADDAITTALIADDAITTALIDDDQITNALMADDAIDTAQIADGAITNVLVDGSAAIAQSKLNLAITTSEIAGATLITSSETFGNSDTTIPTVAAVKAYSDAVSGVSASAPAFTADMTIFDDQNDASPKISLGTSSAECANIQVVNRSGGKLVDYLLIETVEASSDADEGKIVFKVDGAQIVEFDDGAVNIASGKALEINGTSVLEATELGSGVVDSSLTKVGTIATGTWAATDVAIAHGGTGASDVSTARSNLGLGTMAVAATGDYSVVAGSSSIVTVGALNSGSITSGFTSINVGSGTITTTGALAAGATTITGTLAVGNGATSAGKIEIYEDTDDAFGGGAAQKLTITIPALQSDYTLTLPNSAGSADQVLTTDGSGTLTWEDAATIDADLTAIGNLGKTDGNFIVGNGSTWVAESGATVRTSLGLGTMAVAATSDYAALAGSTFTGDVTLTNASTEKPLLLIKNTNADTTSGELRFAKDSASGANSDVMGLISFYGTDNAQSAEEKFATIEGIIEDATNNTEGGQLKFSVATHDGDLAQGLLIEDGSADNEVDVTLGNGGASLVTVTGGLTAAGDIESTSDERVKSDIKTIPNALEKVLQLRGVSFTKYNKESIGLIAQEVEKVVPEVVSIPDSEDGLRSLAYGNMVGLLIEAVKDQQKQIAELTEQVYA